MSTLTAIKSLAQLLANDQNTRIASDAQYTTLTNAALEDWVNSTEELRQENYYAFTAKSFTITAATDLIRLLRAHNEQSGFVPLEVVSQHEFEQKGGYDLAHGPGIPKFVIVDGIPGAYALRVWPPPSSTSNTSTINQGGGINSTDTTVTVTDITKFRSPAGWIMIDSEKILYQNVDTTNSQLKQMVRAKGGTTAASHSNGATITQLDLGVLYSRRAATLSAGSTPEIHPRWHDGLAYWVAANVLLLDGRDPSPFLAIWEKNLKDAKGAIRKEQGAAPSFILPGGY